MGLDPAGSLRVVVSALKTKLTGLSTAVATAVTATDNIVQAIGKLQGQVTNIVAAAKLRYNLTSTWSALPAANSVLTGTRYFVTDIGINGSDWYSDGTKWRLVNGRITLFADNSQHVFTGLTSGAFATFNIPAGVMGVAGSLDIVALFSCDQNANTKSVNFYYGNTNVMACALTNNTSSQMQTIIRNRTANSQVSAVASTGWVYGAIAAPIRELTADTSIAQSFAVNAFLSNTADTIRLESIRIDLIA